MSPYEYLYNLLRSQRLPQLENIELNNDEALFNGIIIWKAGEISKRPERPTLALSCKSLRELADPLLGLASEA